MGGQAGEFLDDYHILLEPSDEVRMGDNGVDHCIGPKESAHSLSVHGDGRRKGFTHEWALGIPTKHYMVMGGVPHQRQRIELAVQRPSLVDMTPATDRIKGGTQVSFSYGIRHEIDLRA